MQQPWHFQKEALARMWRTDSFHEYHINFNNSIFNGNLTSLVGISDDLFQWRDFTYEKHCSIVTFYIDLFAEIGDIMEYVFSTDYLPSTSFFKRIFLSCLCTKAELSKLVYI